jgi:hypothetical protein
VPRIYSATGLKSQEAGLSDGLSSDIAEQSGTGIVVGTKPAAVNKAIAGTALQGDTPLPPGGASDLNDRFGCNQTFRILLSKIEQRAAGSRPRYHY